MFRKTNLKIIICNIIILALSIVSIVTLAIGDFWVMDIELSIKGEKLMELANEESGETGEVITSSGGGEEESSSVNVEELFKQIELNVPIDLKFTSMGLIEMAFGKGNEKITALIDKELSQIVDVAMENIDRVIAGAVSVMVEVVVDEAKAVIEEILKEEEPSSDVTEEQIMQELEEEHGVKSDDLAVLKKDIKDAVVALIDGETDRVATILEQSETLDNLLNVYVEETLAEEGVANPTQEEINQKVSEMKGEIVSGYKEIVEIIEDETGTVNKEVAVVALMKEGGLLGENTEGVETLEDAKVALSSSIKNSMGQETIDTLSTLGMILGIFLLVVIASWAYVALKLILKLFMKNKSVGLFFPKFFGWMPHVIFVGIPQLVFNNFGTIINMTQGVGSAQEMQEGLALIEQMLSINFSSLTWVSALCATILFVIGIPYYMWRRQIRRMLKRR